MSKCRHKDKVLLANFTSILNVAPVQLQNQEPSNQSQVTEPGPGPPQDSTGLQQNKEAVPGEDHEPPGPPLGQDPGQEEAQGPPGQAQHLQPDPVEVQEPP